MAGDLRERVLRYSQTNEYHPYGGLYFDYEIQLTSGDVIGFSSSGWSGVEVAVKQCGSSVPCGGSGAGGVLSDGAIRTSNGDIVTFSFADGDLVEGTHSANLQFLTNAPYFADPMGTFTLSNGDTFSVPLVAGRSRNFDLRRCCSSASRGLASRGIAGQERATRGSPPSPANRRHHGRR